MMKQAEVKKQIVDPIPPRLGYQPLRPAGEASGDYEYDEHRRRGYDVLDDTLRQLFNKQYDDNTTTRDLRTKYTGGRNNFTTDSPWFTDPRFDEVRQIYDVKLDKTKDLMDARDLYTQIAQKRQTLPQDLGGTVDADIAAVMKPYNEAAAHAKSKKELASSQSVARKEMQRKQHVQDRVPKA